MFGKNPIRPVLRDPDHLAVEEVWYTLQGEGPFTGRPALFIRLAGCNLACHFCDTQFEGKADAPQTLSALLTLVATFSDAQRRLVVLTGGEPLRQNCSALIDHLLRTGTDTVQIETAGTVWQEGLELHLQQGRVVIVCSPKTPKVHPMIAHYCDNWKYIVRGGEVDLEDGLPNRGTQVATAGKEQRIYRPPFAGRGDKIWLSPCDEYDEALNRVNVELARDLCLQHGYRLNLQIHKLVGVA